MTVTARKYNPGFLSDDELVASFCVRTNEFHSLIEVLRECTGSASQHQIVIGPRGSGKTSLLLRVGAEIRRDDDLSARFFPVVFAEESYEVSTAGEFWLECVSRLADQAPRRNDGPDLDRTLEELRDIGDDQMLGDRCLGVLQDFSDWEGKRLALIVENLNMMFSDMVDQEAGWRLRKTLQTEPRILLLASATFRFNEIDNPDRALYDLFRVLSLSPLDADECATLWRTVSGQNRAPETIQALRILTGGSPRLLTIVARFGAKLSFRELMADLLNLVDDHTEYFKSHLDALPPQERRVYLALADLWKPATTREIADRARLDTSKCSAHLGRLTDRGAVEVTGGSARRKLYYLAERLYNIYYLMRRARGPGPLIEALIHFMEAYYSPSELKEFGVRIAREATGFDAKTQSVYRTAFDRLTELPSLEAHREELRSLAPWIFSDQLDDYPDTFAIPVEIKALFDKAFELIDEDRLAEALAVWDEVVQRFGASDAPADLMQVSMALVNRGTALGSLNRQEEALASWDEVVRRFGESAAPTLLLAVARALVNKGGLLARLNRLQEALVAWDEAIRRFGTDDAPVLVSEVARAQVSRGMALAELKRSNEAMTAWSEVVQRFSASDEPIILRQVAAALINKGSLLGVLNQTTEALTVWNEVVLRFGTSAAPGILEHVAGALMNTGAMLSQLNRTAEALAAWDEVVRRFGGSPAPPLFDFVVAALTNKGTALVQLNRAEEALVVWSDVERRLDTRTSSAFPDPVLTVLMGKAAALAGLNRPEEALQVWDGLVERFGRSQVPVILESVGRAFVNKAGTLVQLGRLKEALVVLDEVLKRFHESDLPIYHHVVATALVHKGTLLFLLDRDEQALSVWGDVVQRFETSDVSALRSAAETAQFNRAGIELVRGRAAAAIEMIDQVLERAGAGYPENRLPGYLIRAEAHLVAGDKSACVQDIATILTILPTLTSLPKDALDALSRLSVDLGSAQMRDLIQASPAATLLLPLTTALERELGLEPMVAREIEEVAEDVRRGMEEYRRREPA